MSQVAGCLRTVLVLAIYASQVAAIYVFFDLLFDTSASWSEIIFVPAAIAGVPIAVAFLMRGDVIGLIKFVGNSALSIAAVVLLIILLLVILIFIGGLFHFRWWAAAALVPIGFIMGAVWSDGPIVVKLKAAVVLCVMFPVIFICAIYAIEFVGSRLGGNSGDVETQYRRD